MFYSDKQQHAAQAAHGYLGHAAGVGHFRSHSEAFGNAAMAVPPRTPEIARLRDELEKALATCGFQMDELESQLGVVLRGPTPETAPTGNSIGGPSTPMGGHLTALIGMADRLATRMEGLRERLEV